MDTKIIDAYSSIAAAYASRASTSPYNAYYERPAMRSLLPELGGRHVLDAGCGPGIYAEIFVQEGARVTGVDGSGEMVEMARKRLGRSAHIRNSDLREPMSWLEDASVDLVFSALVLDAIEDWRVPLSEFYRVLRPGGCFLFSVGHPFADFQLSETGCYFRTENVQGEWSGYGVTIPFFRRPLSSMTDSIRHSGFALDRVVEPKPVEELAGISPNTYAKLLHEPHFICFRAIRPFAHFR